MWKSDLLIYPQCSCKVKTSLPSPSYGLLPARCMERKRGNGKCNGLCLPFLYIQPLTPSCDCRPILGRDRGVARGYLKQTTYLVGCFHGFYKDPCSWWPTGRLLDHFIHKILNPQNSLSAVSFPLGGPIGQVLRWAIIMRCIWSSGSTRHSLPVQTESTART